MSDNLFNRSGNIIIPNTGVKYSKLLEQFMNPFIKEMEDIEYMEDMIELVIVAWNIATISGSVRNTDLDEKLNVFSKMKKKHLIKKMIAYKKEKYSEYKMFIVDFELEETPLGKDPILRVLTQEEEVYNFNTTPAEDEDTRNFSEDGYINRYAIILKPQEPFINWISTLYPDEDHSALQSTVYLIDDGTVDVEKWLKKKFDTFFKLELEGWHSNKKEWPQKRNYKMFKLWFRVDISQVLYDVEKKPLLKTE